MEELTEAGREARRQYHREYQRKQRKKRQQADIRYWNRKGEQLKDDESLQNKGGGR